MGTINSVDGFRLGWYQCFDMFLIGKAERG
jgi:hypothetical protein